ncbi:DUF6894 family protein [Microvirga sp. GCM10011540]|uniref:DUF6894 family protein n=2 Tax=Microvirga TaxID=186650 RepID=UPI00360C85C9
MLYSLLDSLAVQRPPIHLPRACGGRAIQGEGMPRYFFNVHIGEDVLGDPEGQDLRDADQAWEVARAMAQNLLGTEFAQPINWAACHIEVTDDLDEIVLEFPILEAIDLSGQPH